MPSLNDVDSARRRPCLTRKRNNQTIGRALEMRVIIGQTLHPVFFIFFRPIRGEGFHARQDRPVTGAAAQITIHCAFDVALGRLWVIDQKFRHIHHEADRAITALRTVVHC